MAVSSTRLYAASIAIVSGVYAVASVAVSMVDGPMLSDRMADIGLGGWIMLGIGAVVLVHGVILLTPATRLLGRLSGWLMVVWAAIMLLDQWLIGMRAATAMMPSMESDAGMVAIAVLMLISGLIMIARPMAAEA